MVFDAGQNSTGNFAHLTETGLHLVGSLPPSEHADLLNNMSNERLNRLRAAANHR